MEDRRSAMKMYLPIWSKYRPAILKMMVDSVDQPQHYQLSAHEFQVMSASQNRRYPFVLRVLKGRAINNIRESKIAQELLEILQLSRKASELIETSPYEIELDKKFVLHVSKINEPNTL